MKQLRMALIGALAVFAATLAFAGPSVAATRSPAATAPAAETLGTSVPCTIKGAPSTCHLTVSKFKDINGTLYAVGTVTGKGTTVPFQVPAQAAGTCRILNLRLGPLHLNLLGLVVNLNRVHLTITAQRGPGNLLGNLLCAVAHLLDKPGNVTGQLTHLLNEILAKL